jgi:hypothetical protein
MSHMLFRICFPTYRSWSDIFLQVRLVLPMVTRCSLTQWWWPQGLIPFSCCTPPSAPYLCRCAVGWPGQCQRQVTGHTPVGFDACQVFQSSAILQSGQQVIRISFCDLSLLEGGRLSDLPIWSRRILAVLVCVFSEMKQSLSPAGTPKCHFAQPGLSAWRMHHRPCPQLTRQLVP